MHPRAAAVPQAEPISFQALRFAILTDDRTTIQLYLDLNDNNPEAINRMDGGNTPAMIALIYQQPEALRMIANHRLTNLEVRHTGANFDLLEDGHYGKTALEMARFFGQPELITILEEAATARNAPPAAVIPVKITFQQLLDAANVELPEQLIDLNCPISRRVMDEPVVLPTTGRLVDLSSLVMMAKNRLGYRPEQEISVAQIIAEYKQRSLEFRCPFGTVIPIDVLYFKPNIYMLARIAKCLAILTGQSAEAIAALDNPAAHLRCPFSKMKIIVPVSTPEGITYDRTSLLALFKIAMGLKPEMEIHEQDILAFFKQQPAALPRCLKTGNPLPVEILTYKKVSYIAQILEMAEQRAKTQSAPDRKRREPVEDTEVKTQVGKRPSLFDNKENVENAAPSECDREKLRHSM